MKQLYCRDLRSGDVLLKMAASTFSNNIIRLGQKLVGQPNSFLAHAAIALDTQFVIEAQRAGVIGNHLAMKDRNAGYFVYRCNNAGLAAGAATGAKILFDINKAGGKLKYDRLGAAGSIIGDPGSPKTAEEIDELLDDLLKGQGGAFFCSQFVVLVYQWAALQSGLPAKAVFNISDAKVSPSMLASILQGNAYFRELGYMMPGER